MKANKKPFLRRLCEVMIEANFRYRKYYLKFITNQNKNLLKKTIE